MELHLLTKEKLESLVASGPPELAYKEGITAFDFETPNREADRACSIGVTLIDSERVSESFEILIDPETYFDTLCVGIHGITPARVKGAPTFPEVWDRIRSLFTDRLVIAHNAGFDLRVLKKLLLHYGLDCPPVRYADTLQISRAVYGKRIPNHRLGTLCGKLGIELDAHHAGSDSLGCAEIYLKMLARAGDLSRFEKVYDMER